MELYSVVIIGAGPAGMAAAMQLKRQGIEPVVLERKQVGGLLLNANLVENYPGFVNGIPGPDLAKLFERQANRLGVEISLEEVVSVHIEETGFRIATNLREIQTRILIAATGTIPNELPDGLVGTEARERIYYDVYPLVNEISRDITIIGAGDAAFDYALNLSRRNRITILNRGLKIKALPLLVERVEKESGISYHSEVEVSRIYRNDSGSLVVEAQKKGLAFVCDFVIAAIGRKPNYRFADQSIMDGMNKLLKDQKLFLIGDLQNGSFRQTSIAVGDGIRTAMVIAQILEEG